MRKRLWLCYLGAVLLASAAPAVLAAAQPVATHAAVKKKKKAASSSKKKKRSKSKAHGQMAPTSDRIEEIQAALKREGALDGEPSGKWDDTTVEAMRKYQEDHGLTPTGKIDALTLEKLGLGSETAGKGAPTPMAPSSVPPSNVANPPNPTNPANPAP